MASFETKRRCRRLVNDSVFSDRKLTGHEFAGRSCRINSRRFVPSSEVYGQKPVTLPPGRLRLPTMPSNGIAADREHDGYRCRRRLGRQYRRITALRHNERHMAAYEFCRQCGKAIVVTLRPAVFDRDVLAFDVAGFLQTLAERANEVRIRSGRSAMKITDHWNNRSLRARRERPCGRAAEQRDERAPLHSITSSAATSSLSGTVRPSALAVLRLITRTSLTGAWTGSSFGFAPLRMRSALIAARR